MTDEQPSLSEGSHLLDFEYTLTEDGVRITDISPTRFAQLVGYIGDAVGGVSYVPFEGDTARVELTLGDIKITGRFGRELIDLPAGRSVSSIVTIRNNGGSFTARSSTFPSDPVTNTRVEKINPSTKDIVEEAFRKLSEES